MSRYHPKESLRLLSLVTSGVLLVGSPVVLGLANGGQIIKVRPGGSNQVALTHLKARGEAEINRRLLTLANLNSVVNSTTKLNSSDKTNLDKQISDSIVGLGTLRTALAADTDLTAARNDAQSIRSDYRVYALIVPKTYLLKTADSELIIDTKLTALANKLQTRITAAANLKKNVAPLQTQLEDMNSKIKSAQLIANQVTSKVAPLQPGDYNSDHKILLGQRDQLKQAHQDNSDAYSRASSIIAGLKTL